MSASNVASSSLRPRTRRLISVLDTGDESSVDPEATSTARIVSPAPSPYDSRSASPIPPSRLSRPATSYDTRKRSGPGPISNGTAGRHGRTGHEPPTSLADLWGNSWNALQSIATDLLASDTSIEAAGQNGGPRATKTGKSSYGSRGSASVPPSTWGPGAPTSHPTLRDIGAGTKEEQIASFRAQKRRDMLTQEESSYADALGKFKRRLSDDMTSASAPPPSDNEVRDALVYVHHVQKNDTLAGITIKFNCSANMLRKANRMWPNDTVQSRETIILPVDACGVKGKVVSGPESVDLLGSESEALQAGQAEEVPSIQDLINSDMDGAGGRNRSNSAATSSSLRPTSSKATSSIDAEPPWHHDSWVLLSGFTKPVEIARLSRRALGYFPPARRKSNCLSDLDSPSNSLDLVRPPTDDLLNNFGSPGRHDSPQRRPQTRRQSSSDHSYFPSFLTGPGGVGTMGRNVHFPGPAQDGLNKMFAKHLPDVAPPRTQQGLLTPNLPLYTDDPTPTGSGVATPVFGKTLNLENVGGAIETWMRRMATKAKEPTDKQRAARASVGTPSKGFGGIGDLIEMTDEFEIGCDDEHEEQRGRQGSVFHIASSSTATGYSDSGVRERTTVASSDTIKGRKAD
ncbi:Hypothetical protein R9X50_00149800 [Acrodontium crateriforme]|uniref:LysM domain-containing protein n=1 Tax=Acrodontium crateriforme TaxID=150365 RepID=A0AAQ3LZE7_9PEZI|nr:Hypothetical protein R9X50_00149800 [Acrodontium crateriforme]